MDLIVYCQGSRVVYDCRIGGRGCNPLPIEIVLFRLNIQQAASLPENGIQCGFCHVGAREFKILFIFQFVGVEWRDQDAPNRADGLMIISKTTSQIENP
jgi:hypothetical protein